MVNFMCMWLLHKLIFQEEKLETGINPSETANTEIREVKEETGLILTSYRYRGIVTFVSDIWETEYMHIFHSDSFSGELTDCDEGELCWVDKKELYSLPIWQGDKIFLKLLISSLQQILYGLSHIKGLNTLTSKQIIEEANLKQFQDYGDFVLRMSKESFFVSSG